FVDSRTSFGIGHRPPHDGPAGNLRRAGEGDGEVTVRQHGVAIRHGKVSRKAIRVRAVGHEYRNRSRVGCSGTRGGQLGALGQYDGDPSPRLRAAVTGAPLPAAVRSAEQFCQGYAPAVVDEDHGSLWTL